MYNDTYQYNHKSLKKGELRKILTQLHKDVVVAKDGKDYRGGWLWKPKSISILKDMLNPEYCEK
jgi:hypothetical protein